MWRVRGSTNSIPFKRMKNRLSLIVALDNDGKVYLALSEFNTNDDTFCLFMTKLVKVLQAEDPDFRSNTCFIVDGCKAHLST